MRSLALVTALGVLLAAGADAQVTPPPAPPPTPPSAPAPPAASPGVAAPAHVVQQLQTTLTAAIKRFEAKDLGGVLAYVSEQYRTGPLNKTTVRGQLLAMFQVYEAVQARIRIDEVRMVGEQTWVWSTGEVTGRLPIVGQWMTLFWWNRDLEIARREDGAWRLYGYQQ